MEPLPAADHFEETVRDVFVWSAFSPHHKVELTSSAVKTPRGLVLFDPIPLDDATRARLPRLAPVRAIVLSNANHERDTARWALDTGAPVYASTETARELPIATPFPHPRAWDDWELIALDGGAPGETALRFRDRSLVVFGDAMFNLPGHGLDVLPEKYCINHEQLREQLRVLCAEPFDTALFAHGAPLANAASQQIAAQLQRSARD